MGRYREYNPNQMFLQVLDSEKIKGSSPLLTIIDWFVEEKVDLKPFSAKLQNQDGGAEAINPKVILKILFYGYSTGIRSYREIEDHLQWDPHFLVLSCQQKVDHSTLCRFMQKYCEEVEQVLMRLYYVLDQMGIIKHGRTAIDGTKIAANVSLRRFVGTAEDYQKKSEKLGEQIRRMKEESENEQQDNQSKVERLEASKQEIDRFLQELEQIQHNGERIHPVDPDARFVKDEEDVMMGYNAQVAVDRESHLIVASDVFNQASDSPLFQPMVEHLKNSPAAEKLTGSPIVADAGYFSSENVVYAEEEKLDVYIPEGKGKNGTKESGLQTITSKDCTIENQGEIKRLTCPGGQHMECSKESHCGKGKFYYLFYPIRDLCNLCPLKSQCLQNVRGKKVFKVKREYMNSIKSRERMKLKLSTSEGKEIYRSRASTVEHVFGTIKEALHFRKFLHRGLKKIRLIWRLICAAYNFRRLSTLGFSNMLT